MYLESQRHGCLQDQRCVSGAEELGSSEDQPVVQVNSEADSSLPEEKAKFSRDPSENPGGKGKAEGES